MKYPARFDVCAFVCTYPWWLTPAFFALLLILFCEWVKLWKSVYLYVTEQDNGLHRLHASNEDLEEIIAPPALNIAASPNPIQSERSHC